ncbi:LysR family transcriptional regulator [Tropicimonas marinistellae]|uniref:LysR family transcriptional regulator n=1 Tax=Tropicimonas marinistellae TaxID=1739787 RepID=UPI000832CC7B|nr:LysR family transcriptional regulator [Tropicimonas marinistellae]
MLDWNDLRLILEIARAGSLSGAARKMGVNHATVSRQLQRLETSSARRFFERMPDGMIPTADGEVAVARAETMEAEVLALDLDLTARAPGSGVLRVTVPPLMADAAFARDIALWRDTHPNVDLHLLGDNRILDLHRREADVAIRIQRHPSESLWGRKVANQRAGYYATPAFVERHAAALAGDGPLPLVGFTAWDRPIAPSILERFPNTVLAALCDDMIAARSLVREGIAFTRMPHFIGGTDPALVRLPGTEMSSYAPIWVLTHPDLRRAPLVAGFLRFIAERFSGRAAYYAGPDD